MVTLGFAQEYPPIRGPGIHPHGPSPEGPFNDEVHAAVSNDGFSFEILPGPFFRHASVPDILELKKDSKVARAATLLLYFVDFANVKMPGSEGLSLATSTVHRANFSCYRRHI